jgi:hypothetical protein
MQKILVFPLVGVCAALALRMAPDAGGSASAAAAAEPAVIHNVYFALKDKTPEAAQKLVDSCKKYLAPQPGVTYFAVGVLAKELNRPVNDLDWDVGLHVVFKDKAAHDKYQTDAQHEKFIAENKENWAKVRVFDTLGR